MARVPGSLESAVESKFSRGVKELGGLAIKMPGGEGLPDRLVLLPGGVTRLVELKKDGGAVRPLQGVWHRKAERLGHPVDVVVGLEGVAAWVRKQLREGASHGSEQ